MPARAWCATSRPDTMRHVAKWLAVAGVTEGNLFRTVLQGGRIGDTLDGTEVSRRFKGMAKTAGLVDVTRISGHSFRVGAAQDMVRHGVELPAVNAGRRLAHRRNGGALHRPARRAPIRRGEAGGQVLLQSSELSMTDLREGSVRFSGGNLEQFGDELRLGLDVVTADVSNLPLPHHCHRLVACQRSSSRPETAKAKSRAG